VNYLNLNQSQFLKGSRFNSGSINTRLSNLAISQLMWLSQDYTQLSQFLGFRFQISTFSTSPKTQNMQKFDQDSHKTISIWRSINQPIKSKATKLTQDWVVKLEFAWIQGQTAIFKLKITKHKTKFRKEKRRKRKLSQNRASIFRSQTRHGILAIFTSPFFLSLIQTKTKRWRWMVNGMGWD